MLWKVFHVSTENQTVSTKNQTVSTKNWTFYSDLHDFENNIFRQEKKLVRTFNKINFYIILINEEEHSAILHVKNLDLNMKKKNLRGTDRRDVRTKWNPDLSAIKSV